MAWWPLGRSLTEPTGGRDLSAAPAAPHPASLPGRRRDDWRDLPAVQRTLSQPLRPVAVSEDFRGSLASFNDPSFLAPLAHQVDPSTGGLVEGLVSPGTPYGHPSGPDLPVPRAPRASAVPLQRATSWGGSLDLPTVAWELPGVPPMENPVEEPVASGGAGQTEGNSTPGASLPAPTPPPPPHVTSAISIPVQRSLAGVAASPSPAVTVAPPARTVPPLSISEFPVAALPVADRWTNPRIAEPPTVSRMVDVPVPLAPIVGSAEGITGRALPDDRLDEVTSVPVTESPSAQGPAVTDTVAEDQTTGDGSGEQPVDGPHIQRLAADSEPTRVVGGAPDLVPGAPRFVPVLRPFPTPTMSPATSLPVVQRVLDTPHPPAAALQSPVEASTASAPTLGPRLTQAPLAVQRAPLTRRAAPPTEPAVQRLEFLSPNADVMSGRRPARPPSVVAAPITSPAPAANAFVASPPSDTHSSSQASQVQRSREAPVFPREASESGRLEIVASAMPAPAAPPASVQRTTLDSPVHDLADSSPESAPLSGGLLEVATPADLPDPTGPAVTAEPWASTPSVQRSGTNLAKATSSTSPVPAPLVVSRQQVSNVSPGTARPGEGVSFASMFGSAGTTETSAAEDGFTSVQLQAAGETPAPEPASETATSGPVSTPSPPSAAGTTSATDLDELARRLYEPLSARLRAELWLDRERAGLMSDV
jgi:hypothetical protein